MAILRYKSVSSSALALELTNAARAYLIQQRDHKYADPKLLTKLAFVAVCTILVQVLLLHMSHPLSFLLLYIAWFGLIFLLAINVLHDASHAAIFKSTQANYYVLRLVGILVGVDGAIWRIRHVHVHHAYPNIDGYDLDIEPNPFLRQTPYQAKAVRFRYQHLYWPVIAGFGIAYLAWYGDWMDMLNKTKLHHMQPLHKEVSWPVFLLSKALHLMLTLVFPIVFLAHTPITWWWVLGCYLTAQFIGSMIILSLFLGAHWADTDFFKPDQHLSLPHTWQEHQFYTCCDWVIQPRYLTYIMGGIEYHLTHHLFPTYSHRHHPALAQITQRLAQKYRLPYRRMSHAQMWHAQQQFLKRLGTD